MRPFLVNKIIALSTASKLVAMSKINHFLFLRENVCQFHFKIHMQQYLKQS